MSFRHTALAAACLLAGTVVLFAEEQNVQQINVPPASAQGDAAQPIKVSARDKAACMPDALRLCRDAVPNVRNVLMCFDQNRDKISSRCRTVLAGHGFQ